MAGKQRIERELAEERQELADAVGVLREDLGEVAGKAKKVPLALGGVVALALTTKKLLRRRNR
ncbi:MAG TPA: hypothetical protein VHD91_09410 [Gaiellaceae bacterium]|nr:hypothetical protein [Gaiellaceae bacterium]